MNTFGFPIIFVVALIILVGQTSAQQAPAQGGTKHNVYEEAKSIVGIGWRNASDHKEASEAVVAHLKKLETPGYQINPSFSELIEMSAGNDLLTQALFKGYLGGGSSNINDLLKFYDKIAASKDPEDLPGRNRIWANRNGMLIGIGRGITQIKSGRSLSLEEIQLISRDPQQWKLSLGIVEVSTKATTPTVITPPVEGGISSSEKDIKKTADSLDSPEHEKAPKAVKNTINFGNRDSSIAEKSNAWIYLASTIVAFTVAAFLLKKRFSR